MSGGSNGSRSPAPSLSGLLGSSSPSRVMEEDALLRQLGAQSSSRRAEALRTLRNNIQQNAGRLVFGNKKALFSTLSEVLVDARKDVRISCIQLVSEIVQGSEWDLDHCRAAVLPKLIWCLRDDSPTVRKELVQTLHVYLKCTKITEDVLFALIEHGLENYDPSVRRATAVILPILLTKEFNSESLFAVTLCLAKKLNGGNVDDPFTAFATMGRIKRHVGDQEFNSYLKRLPPTLRRDYNKLTEIQFEPHTNLNGRDVQEIEPSRNLKTSLRFRRGSVGSVQDVPLCRELSKDLSNLEFGIIPQELYVRLLDHDDYKTRAHAVEELKNVLSDLNFNSLSFPAILGFIGFLSNLLDDSNFKVVHGTLEIINLLVVKLNHDVVNYLKPITSTTVKVLGDNKAVTKQEYMKVFMGLMKQVGPQRVLDMLLDNIKHKNSRVREEVLNIVIASLLTHPSEDFDLPSLCRTVAPTLTDSKRRIRHAALEAFAVLASSIGTNRTFLVKAVDAVEIQEDGDGLMAAVQARLARRTLPKLTSQGLVEYAIPMPTSAHGRGVQIPLGSDTEWLLATGRTGSAHGDQETDFWNYGSPSPISDECISSRRVLSAGRGKNKLPWENANSVTRGSIQQARLPNTAPIEQVQPYNDVQQTSKLRTIQLMQAADDIFFTRKSNVRSAKLNEGLDFNLESNLDGLRNSGFGESPQSRPSGKRGLLGYSRMLHTQSTSVDSDLQYFGIGNHLPQDKANTSPVHTSITGGVLKKIHEPSFHELNLTFSNSWPNKQFEGLHKPSPQRKLINHLSEELPILGDSLQETRSPIPLKPTLVKSMSSRRGLIPTKPVPPIPRGTSPMVEAEIAIFGNRKGTSKPDSEQIWEEDGGKKIDDNLKLDLSSLDYKEDEADHEEMMISLKSLRNSAAKKRAKLSSSTSDIESPDSDLKLELGVDSTSRTSSPYTSTYTESGVYSQESLTSPFPCDKKITSDSSSRLGSKQRLGGVPSGKARLPASVENSSVSGVTLRDKATSDVSIIGQRMSYRNGILDSEEDKRIEVSSLGSKFHSKEQQKTLTSNKAVRGLTGSTISMQQMNSHDVTSGSEDSVVIVGKGVFGSALMAPLTCSQATISALDNEDDISSPRHKIEPPSGIYGRGVHQNSHTSIVTSESEREICMSKSARDKTKQRKREGNEHPAEQGDQEYKDHENREEHLRLKNMEPNKMGTESLSISGDVLLKNDYSPGETSHLSPTHLKRTSSIRKNRTPNSPNSGENSPLSRVTMRKDQMPSIAHSPDVVDPAELRPFSKPEVALSEALKQLADDDWEKKIEGLNCFRSLCTYHPDAIIARLHETVFAAVQEVKNLRSGVSRVAILGVADMFTTLKKNMDQELDNTVRTLLHKAGESSIFIREDVDKALNAMIVNVTPARALSSLISGGLNHLNPVVRKCAALHLSNLLERMEPSRLLPGIKDVTDRIIPAVAKFVQDVSPETRYYGRKMLFLMMSSHHDFDKVLEKHLTPKDLPCIRDTVSNLQQKGLGEMPLDTPSAKGRRSHPSSGGSFRASASSREVHSLTGRDTAEGVINLRDYTWKPTQRNLIENAEYIKDITNLLGAKDFRDRSRGIEQLVTNCQNNQDLVITNIVKIFDAFRPRLHDFNSKVNQMALEAMRKIIPLLKENLGQVLNIVVPAIVDNNLNSKNPGIYNAAISVVQTLIHHIDNSLLLQLFCNKALFLNGKAKQDMTEKLADIVPELYTRKPQVVEQKVLPVLWHLLGNMTNSGSIPGSGGNIRVAAVKLANVLFAAMGQNLIDQASNQQQNIGKTLQDLLDYNP
eukprot:gi/632971096/ref/XP_007902004.1/ PREDICTED: protein FAM179B [Callorhinchus milii]